jgi:transposase InsO family protein
MSPALIRALQAVAAEAAAAGHGGKGAVYDAACERLGMTRPTLYRKLKEVTMTAARKRRTDAGEVTLPIEEARIISAYLMEGYRANNKRIITLVDALRELRANSQVLAGRVDTETGEYTPLSESAVSRALYHYQLHPTQLRRPAPAQPQRSLHPNDVWQIDASISTLFYVPERQPLADMAPSEFYSGKPQNFEKIKKQRLTRYVVTDHTSGAIFVHYVAGGESIVNLAECFFQAMAERPGQAPYGVPYHLVLDPGSASESGAFKGLLRRLKITPVVNAPGNPRAKGQVENAHNLVEMHFEHGFKMTTVPDLTWINGQANRWMIWYNCQQVHTRHDRTRRDKWLEIRDDQLRLVDVTLCRQLLTQTPETRKVNDYLEVEFRGASWSVRAVPKVMVGETLAVTVNPLNPDTVYVVDTAQGEETLIEIPRVNTDDHGFREGAALIGREYKSHKDTVADTHRKGLERLATETTTDEAAAVARKDKKIPFGGRIDPYRHLDDVPDVAVLPRRGHRHGPEAPVVAELTLTVVQAAQRLKALLGERWTPAHYQALGERFPDGVPEGAIDQLAAEWGDAPTTPGKPNLRAVGGER